LEKNLRARETRSAAQAYKRCNARQCPCQKISMNEVLSAALIGAVFGYLIARHSSEVEWILHTLIG
jgi:F0F1-type ATP synthase assembly protein I